MSSSGYRHRWGRVAGDGPREAGGRTPQDRIARPSNRRRHRDLEKTSSGNQRNPARNVLTVPNRATGASPFASLPLSICDSDVRNEHGSLVEAVWEHHENRAVRKVEHAQMSASVKIESSGPDNLRI